MKILYVSNLYGDNARGGAEGIVEMEARAMLAAGHAVAVVRGVRSVASVPAVPTDDGGPRVISYVPHNIYFYSDDHRHGMAARLAWHVLDTFNRTSASAFKKILETEQPDVVHTHNLMGLGFMLPATIRLVAGARKRAGAKPLRHVHTVHDVQLLHPSGLLSPSARGTTPIQKIYISILRALMGSPDVVLFPSSFLRALHDCYGFFRRSRREVQMNAAPAPAAVAPPPSSVPRFLFVGQIEKHKGVLVLAEAWEKSGLSSKGAMLELVGEGTATIMPASGMTLFGKLGGSALTAAYDRASFLVLPSIVVENQPNVIMEAMSRGIPVIASISGGIPELVKEGETGFLVPAGDVAALAAAMTRAAAVARQPEAWQKMSANSLAWASDRGAAAHVEGLLRAYGQA